MYERTDGKVCETCKYRERLYCLLHKKNLEEKYLLIMGCENHRFFNPSIKRKSE